MPGTTIGISMNYGYPGQVSRHGGEISRTRPVAEDSGDIKFGAPVVQNEDGSVHAWTENDDYPAFSGIAMRKVKGAKIWPYQNFGYYSPGEPCDILQFGSIMGVCAWGDPHVGSSVYVRTKVVEGTSPDGAAIGDFGAENEEGNCVELLGVMWASGKDERNVAEIAMQSRNGL